MVEIAIAASGTRGDVQPYIALGKGLKDAGYSVRLLSSDNFEELVTEAGLDFAATGPGADTVLESEEWKKTIEGGNFLKIMAKMRSEMQKAAGDMAQRLPNLLKGSDLIISGVVGLTGTFSAAEMLKIPVIQAYVFPFTPTSEFPSPLTPTLPFGSLLNSISFHVMRQVMWQSFKVTDTVTRQMLGLPKGSFWGPFKALQQKQVPAMYGYSKYVLPRPQDWPENQIVTGYWFLDEPDGWTPPPDLVAFLEAGEAPVYVGFGSMVNRNPQEAGQIALEALQRSGQRGVLATGWGGLKPSDVPETVHLISSIPHSWLFGRMQAVVHHGGAGTTAAGLRAGVPSIVVPFSADQPFWGKRVRDLGVGAAPIPRKKLTSQRLADAISECVTNTTMRQKASTLGEQIRDENGVANAVAFVERFSQQRVRPQPSFKTVSST